MKREESLDNRFSELHDKIDLIMNNHLAHIASDLKEVIVDVAWLKKFFWIIASASIGAVLTALFGLILKQ